MPMRYSSWSTSKWFTYMCVFEGPIPREEVEFVIYGVMTVPYLKLKNRIPEVIKEIKALTNNKYTTKDYKELRKYMIAFLKDVKDRVKIGACQ